MVLKLLVQVISQREDPCLFEFGRRAHLGNDRFTDLIIDLNLVCEERIEDLLIRADEFG